MDSTEQHQVSTPKFEINLVVYKNYSSLELYFQRTISFFRSPEGVK